MWAKGTQITQVTNPRGTNRNLQFCREQLLRALGKSEKKVKALYSFVITCLPHIHPSRELEHAKNADLEAYLKIIDDHSDLYMVVWFCVQLKFEFSPGMREWSERVAKTFNLKVTAGQFRPEASLKKVADLISKMPSWKAAGVAKEVLAKISHDTKRFVSFRVAKVFEPGLEVSMRSYSLLIIKMASNPEEADDFYDKCERIISSRTQSIAPSLCYFPCGWKLNAWQEFVDPSICKHLPEIPQYEHLLDPHQGSTKATGAGVNRAIDDTAKSTQNSQLSVMDLTSPTKDVWTGRGKDVDNGRGVSQFLTTTQIAREFSGNGGAVTQANRARARKGVIDSDVEESPPKRLRIDTGASRASANPSVPATSKRAGAKGRETFD